MRIIFSLLCLGMALSVALAHNKKSLNNTDSEIEYIKVFSDACVWYSCDRSRLDFVSDNNRVHYIKDKTHINAFATMLDTIAVVKELPVDVYECDIRLNPVNRFILEKSMEGLTSPRGYAIIHWKNREPELLWLTCNSIQRDNREYSVPEGFSEWMNAICEQNDIENAEKELFNLK